MLRVKFTTLAFDYLRKESVCMQKQKQRKTKNDKGSSFFINC